MEKEVVKSFAVGLYILIMFLMLADVLLAYDFFPTDTRFTLLGGLGIWALVEVISLLHTPPSTPVGYARCVPLVPKREKTTSSGENDLFEYAIVEVQGWRPSMEDASLVELCLTDPRLNQWSLFAVFDGHGGAQVSRWLASNMVSVLYETTKELYPQESALPTASVQACMKATCRALDVKLRACEHFDLVGSTCNWVLMNQDTMICANVGDSRCIYSTRGKAVDVSVDHKPERKSERERIEKAGGRVCQSGPCYRVDGWGLNLSRAFGDFHYKQRLDLPAQEQKVCAEPEVFVVNLNQDPIDFVVIGCDGVFELSSQEIVDVVWKTLHSKGLTASLSALADRCVSPSLIQTQGKGGDNVSAIIIAFKDAHAREKAPEEATCKLRPSAAPLIA